MKKLIGLLIGILIIYVIYFDLTKGTLELPSVETKPANAVATLEVETKIPSFSVKVKPGETVISIVEHHIDKPLPVSISDLIEDFKQLNPGESPEKIRIGSTYHFPDYSK
ncbi:LysM peptidoglycan-binding domain-containing protein [Neobacillus dielmonensis]|uniref:LysM peptidoglycan-binding domain-containing protein n=1 Tax=Neobacillus dielmonensis TaxID=1347369 RepID=UPI0005AB3150|nr:LysM domain-containing protein [Neobacillus dielmonensis]